MTAEEKTDSMDEKITEAATKFVIECDPNFETPEKFADILLGFKEGANWGISEVFRWIPTKEKLPRNGQKVIARRKYDKDNVEVIIYKGTEIDKIALKNIYDAWRPINQEDMK